MKLVFFDIECASVFKYTAKICAFGYVVCDEQFNILEKEDILINPKGKFHLTDVGGDRGIVLPYEYSEFKKYPAFPQVFGKIKRLLEDRENLVFGHATHNDVKYLNLETNRFHLPSFNFTFSDSQLMYMTAIGDFSRQFGLEYITGDLDVQFTPHRAADDAYATMKVVEALCKKYDCDCAELEKILAIKRGRIKNHRIIRPTSQAQIDYIADRERAKRERAVRRNKFFVFVSRRKVVKGGKLRGKVFGFSRPLEDDIELSMPLVERIYAQGGRFSQKLEECDVYVCFDDDVTVRTGNARKMDGLEVINTERLKELLND